MNTDPGAFMSKEEDKFITDEFGVAYPIHAGFTLMVAGAEKVKRWYEKELAIGRRKRLNYTGRRFPYRPAHQVRDHAGRVLERVVSKTPPPKVQRSPRRAPKVATDPTRPRQAPGGRSRRPRAAPSRKDRYRHGWNNHFSIMPLDAKRRPYYRWPRF